MRNHLIKYYNVVSFIKYPALPMVVTSPYYLLVTNQNAYQELKSQRSIDIDEANGFMEDQEIIFLVYIKEENKIVAEYDLEKVEVDGSKYKLNLEPVYNAPDGLEMTDLILLTLPGYDISTWKKNLEKGICKLSENDFNEIIERLKS